MTGFRLQPRAVTALEDIYAYSLNRWGRRQADSYASGFFESFEKIVSREVVWRPIDVDLGVEGFRCRYRRHLIYWRPVSDGMVIIFAILHENMHEEQRLRATIEGQAI